MPSVEVYEKGELEALFVGDFAFLPRLGEMISKEMGGYFNYYRVVEIWHREEGATGMFVSCVRVELDD